MVPEEEKNRLLRRYWTIPERQSRRAGRQVATSVVLADVKWAGPVSG
jgi:hypothetical protein